MGNGKIIGGIMSDIWRLGHGVETGPFYSSLRMKPWNQGPGVEIVVSGLQWGWKAVEPLPAYYVVTSVDGIVLHGLS